MSEALAPIETRVSTVSEKVAANLPRLQQGNKLGVDILNRVKALVIETDEQRDVAVEDITKAKTVYTKLNQLRTEITKPLDELTDYLISFERVMDPKGKDNLYASARKVVEDYDQKKLEADKAKAAAALMLQQIADYKAELTASVGKAMIGMMTGIKSNKIQGMAAWEKSITLENFDKKDEEIRAIKPKDLDMAKYDANFHTNFAMKSILNKEDAAEFIQSLKAVYPYETFNKTFIELSAEILNTYRAKMPQIKEELQKNDADRIKRLEAEEAANLAKVQEENKAALTEVANKQDMSLMSNDFSRQMQTADISDSPTQKIASFENDNGFLLPFLEVVTAVAKSGKLLSIRNKKNEYIDSIDWFLKAFAPLGIEVKGIKIEEKAKTIIKKKKDSEL